MLENYDRLVLTHTGQLREAVRTGDLKDQGTDLYQFAFKIADLPSGREQGGKSTGEYGPIVFRGRGAILTPQKKMRFAFKGRMIYTSYVGAAAPRDIFVFDSAQIKRINEIVLKPITADAKAWVKRVLEGKGTNGD